MTENKKNIKRYFAVLCLACSVAFAPVCPANARSHHHGDTFVAAAIGGAVAGLVGAVVQNTLNPDRTVVVEEPVYIEPEPVVVRKTIVVREPYHHRTIYPARHTKYRHRHR